MAYAFKRQESEDFVIVDLNDSEKVVGKIRVKPSGVLWSPKGGHKFFKLTIQQFAKFAEEHGTLKKM